MAQLEKELLDLQQKLLALQKQVRLREPAPEWVVWLAIVAIASAASWAWRSVRQAEIPIRERQTVRDERLQLWKAFLETVKSATAEPTPAARDTADRLKAVAGQVSSLAALLGTVEGELMQAYERIRSLEATTAEIKERTKEQRSAGASSNEDPTGSR